MSSALDAPKKDPTTDALLQALGRRFSKRENRAEPAPLPVASVHLQAAAVLHLFDPRTLVPFDVQAGSGIAEKAPADLLQLLAQSAPAIGWRGTGLRTLNQEARATALRELGDRETMRRALDANPDRPATPVQKMIDAWLSVQGILDLQGLSFADLESLGQLYAWGMAAYGGLPDRNSFDSQRARRSAVALFEHLVDAHFIGRQAELQMLRDHVGVVSPTLWSKVRRFIAPDGLPPLFIWGPGGTGKTALIGKFLLEHVESSSGAWFPFAYLPFDSETLDVDEPFTLLIEAAAQLYRQMAQSDVQGRGKAITSLQQAFHEFQEEVGNFRDTKSTLSARAFNERQTPNSRAVKSLSADEQLYVRFANLLRAAAEAASALQNASETPVLLVFDTFEEVQYRTQEELRGFWRMLEFLQSEFPQLRIVISGRQEPALTPRRRYAPKVQQLSDLAEADGVELLKHLGLGDTDAATAVVKQVGGNPLTLRLAARVAVDEAITSQGLADLQSRRLFFLKLAPELIRGQLYRRVLNHIHDADVRTLAHPGMVLRRVTPEIIEQVLAPVCGLQNVDRARAESLFDELRREHALVRLDDDNSLRYREEVRDPMRELMVNDKPGQVAEIHRRIVDYYRGRPPAVAERAEELYHAMMVGAEPADLDPRWMEGVERHLASAIAEIPAPQRIWLALHMSIQLSDDVTALADTQQWEQINGRRIASAMRSQGPQAALALLNERRERTSQSPLYALEARAYIALGRAADAALLLEDCALGEFPPLGNQGRLAELLWLRAQAAQWMDDRAQALSWLRRLDPVAASLRSALPLVQTLCEVLSADMPVTPSERADVSQRLAKAVDRLDPLEVDRERAMLRLVLVRLPPHFTTLFGRLIPSVIGDFQRALARGELDHSPFVEPFTGWLQKLRSPASVPEATMIDGSWLASVVDVLCAGLSGPDPDPVAMEALRCLMQAERLSLLSATLAGLDEYREPWELLIHAEVAA